MCINAEPKTCSSKITRVVQDHQLENGRYLRQAKRFLYDLNLPPARWRETLLNWLSTYTENGGIFLDAEGHHTELDLEAIESFDPADDDYHADRPIPDVKPMPDPFPEWMEDFATPVGPWVRPFLINVTKERARVVLTITRARFPNVDRCWDCSRGDELNFLI